MTARFIQKSINLILIMCCLVGFLLVTRGIEVPGNNMHIQLSDEKVTADGYTVGRKGDVYLSRDVVYYEDREFYENGSLYGEGTPEERHSKEVAAATTVVNITKPGTYHLQGKLSHGQIRVDLGESAYKDEKAVVTLVLEGADINCDVAPAIVFLNVYECDKNETVENASRKLTTEAAGANLVIADGSVNNVHGSYVAKIYKSNETGKKLWKQDGAIYSYMTLNIHGGAENSGVLNLTSEKEGISSEKHITINGGNLNITAKDDGINVNEYAISLVTVNGGTTHIIGGLGPLGGDGIDSNGWIVVNGGTLVSVGYQSSDTGVDNDRGLYINGGTVVSLGSAIDYPSHKSTQKTLKLKFMEEFSTEEAVTVTDSSGKVVFCYDPSEDSVAGRHISNRLGISIASPNFTVGESYRLYMGGTVDGEHINGIYDISSIKGFTGAVRQMHLSDEVFDRWGLYETERQKYEENADFVLYETVSCFADITDSTI